MVVEAGDGVLYACWGDQNLFISERTRMDTMTFMMKARPTDDLSANCIGF